MKPESNMFLNRLLYLIAIFAASESEHIFIINFIFHQLFQSEHFIVNIGSVGLKDSFRSDRDYFII